MAKENETYTEGNVVALASTNTLIKSSNKKKLVAAYGLDNLVVVDTEGVLLVMPKDKTEKISELLDEIKQRGLENYL